MHILTGLLAVLLLGFTLIGCGLGVFPLSILTATLAASLGLSLVTLSLLKD